VDDVSNPKVEVRKKHDHIKYLCSFIPEQLMPSLVLDSFYIHGNLLVQDVVVQPVNGYPKNPTTEYLVVSVHSIVNSATSHCEDYQESEQ